MTSILNKNFPSTNILTNRNVVTYLLSTTACVLLLSATSVQAVGYATVTNTAGATHNNIIPHGTNGVKVGAGDVGIKIVVNYPISSNLIAIEATESGGDAIEIILDNDVESATGWSVRAISPNGAISVSGNGNVTAATTGLYLTGAAVSVSGSGTYETAENSVYIEASDQISFTASGKITNKYVGAVDYSALGLINTGNGNVTVSDIGELSSIGTNTETLYISNIGTGNTVINTSNLIANDGVGTAKAIRVKTSSGTTDITVANIILNAASKGNAIFIDNAANATNGSNLTLNSTISGGDAAAGFKAIKASGNTAVGFNLTNNASATLNGLVDANGWSSNGSTFINSGTWNAFGGVSNFSGAFSNSGTLDLQNSKTSDGTNFESNVTFAPTSILKVDVDKNGTIDKIKTSSGNVILGGTLNVNAMGAEANYSAINGTVYTLVDNSGAGTTSGSFSILIDNLAFLDLVVNTAGGDGNDVTLKFVSYNSIDFKPHATGDNQISVATTMDGFDYSSTDGADLKAKFLSLTNDESKQTIGQLGGEDYLASSRSAAPIAQRFQSVMMDGASNANTAPKPIGFTITATGDVPHATIEYWAKAVGSYSKVNSTTTNDLTTKNLGIFGGSDYIFNDDLTVGVSAGYTNSSFSIQTAGSSSRANNFHVGASVRYGATAANKTGLGVAAGTGVTKHIFTTKRVINIGATTRTASGKYSGTTLGAVLNARYGFNVPTKNGNFVISTFLGLDASRTHNNAFTETGAGALNISTEANTSNQLGSLIGVGLASKIGDVDVGISAGWRHEFGDVNYTNVNTLAGSTTSFTRTTPTEARNKLILKANISFKPTPNSQVTFTALGEKSRTNVNLGATASFKLKF